MPQAAVVGLPGVKRVRRFEDGAVALDGLNLGGDRGDEPVTDVVEDEEGVSASSTLTARRLPCARTEPLTT